MFFPCGKKHLSGKFLTGKSLIGKEACVLPARKSRLHRSGRERRFSVIGSMTVEAALALPIFLSAVLAVLQFAKIMLVSSALLAGMQTTAKEMGAYAYIQAAGISAGDGVAADLLTGGLSAAYARSQIQKESGFTSDLGSISLLQSNFVSNDILDLAVAYYPASDTILIPTPRIKAMLRARVRAWTGREGTGNGDGGNETDSESSGETVYVTATGKVYHKDLNCTHIKLSIQSISRDSLSEKRNVSGGKYHACEKCGAGIGNTVYITEYGDRYHSSLDCSGLKRSVVEVHKEDLEGWKACSKCG